jgi:hypothetical protein
MPELLPDLGFSLLEGEVPVQSIDLAIYPLLLVLGL